MYLDFDDHRPDTPHLPPAFTRLERMLATAVAYLVLVIAYLLSLIHISEPTRPY